MTPITLEMAPDWPITVGSRARQFMVRHESCAQSVLAPFLEDFEIESPLAMRLAGAFHSGMCQSLTCGILTGGLMALGLLIGRDEPEQGLDGLLPIISPAQELKGLLEKEFGSVSCKELTGVDFTDLEQAVNFLVSDGHTKCIERVGSGAEIVARFIAEQAENGTLFCMKAKKS
jgi:C_GCAxxG_C_C family probable redox protein